MRPAVVARVGFAAMQLVMLPDLLALPAGHTIGMDQMQNEIETRVIIGEISVKIVDGILLHGSLPLLTDFRVTESVRAVRVDSDVSQFDRSWPIPVTPVAAKPPQLGRLPELLKVLA